MTTSTVSGADVPAVPLWRRPLWISSGAVFLLGFATGSWRYGHVVAIRGEIVAPAVLRSEVFAPGSLDATRRALLGPKVGGRIVSLNVDTGDRLAADSVVARMDTDSATALLRQARAQVEADRAALAAARAQLARAASASRHAAATRDRLAALAHDVAGSVSIDDLEAATTAAETAAAEATQARGQAATAEAAVVAAEAAAAYQETLVADTVLQAPFAGLVTQRLHSVGDIVGAGTGLVEFVDDMTLFVAARFDESLLDSVRPGALARITFRQAPDTILTGRVARVDRAVDGETREFSAEIALASPPARWALGQRADVYVQDAPVAAAVVAPHDWIVHRENGAFVWVLRDGRATLRSVELGLADVGRVQILAGLQAGESILDPTGHPFRGERVRLVTRADVSP